MNIAMERSDKKTQKRFEFTLYLNDNIIVQRYFNIIGFNYRAINSLNFKEAVDDNMYLIKEHIKTKTLDFMNTNAMMLLDGSYYEQSNPNDKIKMVIKMDDKQIAYREWSATIYPVKVRFTIDIREHIYDIITRIQKCLSEKNENLETTYLTYNLAVNE
jgi:hypothetical protein